VELAVEGWGEVLRLRELREKVDAAKPQASRIRDNKKRDKKRGHGVLGGVWRLAIVSERWSRTRERGLSVLSCSTSRTSVSCSFHFKKVR
jgi:hypothetical protein